MCGSRRFLWAFSLRYLSFWACPRIVSDLFEGVCKHLTCVLTRVKIWPRSLQNLFRFWGLCKHHIRIDRLEIGTNARMPDRVDLTRQCYFCVIIISSFFRSSFLAVCIFPILFGIFRWISQCSNCANSRRQRQRQSDNSDSDNESCLES